MSFQVETAFENVPAGEANASCSVLQCVAECCGVLQCDAVRCSAKERGHRILQSLPPTLVRACRSVLHCLALCVAVCCTVCCSVLQCRVKWVERLSHNREPIAHCNTLQHIATHCSTLQHTENHCKSLQITATHCNR